MKKVIIALVISVFIMFILPLLIVEIVKPQNNAVSTAPVTPVPAVSEV